MALKTLLLRKRLDNKKKELEALRASVDFESREAELTKAIDEVETDEQRAEIEELVNQFDTEKTEHDNAVSELEREIAALESDLAAEEAAQDTTPPAADPEPAPTAEPATRETATKTSARKDEKTMMTAETRARNMADIVTRDDVKDLLTEVRTAISQKRNITNVGLTIPEVILELIREEVYAASKLLPFLNVRAVGGTARQTILGAIPEGVWTECCGKLNELTLGFSQVSVDCYKVGGYIAICNATLADSDVALASEIVTALGGAIAKALDKAAIFGTGTKMPVGIVTRLAQAAKPADWSATAPAWTNLSTSNVLTLDLGSAEGVKFFRPLISGLGVTKPVYSGEGLFWAMTRKTHMDILTRALAFNAAGAMVSGTSLFPVLGGTVVEVDDKLLPDFEIVGGYGKNYLMAERQGVEFGSSDIPLFLQDQTVFKGTARYDGAPVAGEAFVIVNYNNVAPTTTKSFEADTANS